MFGKVRYVLLAATLLSTLALPQWTRASDTQTGGKIILAEVNPNDPQQKGKGKQQPQQQQKQQQQQQQQKPGGAPNFRGNPLTQGSPPGGQQNQTGQQNQSNPPGGANPRFGRQGPPNQTGQQNQNPPGGGPQNPRFGRQGPPNQTSQQNPPGQQFGRQGPPSGPGPKPPGQQFGGRQGDPGAGPRYGNLDQLRGSRQERIEGNRRIFVEPGNRFIVREGDRVFVRHDEGERFGRWDPNARSERRGSESWRYFHRPGGYDIIDVTGPDGRLLRRIRRGPDGREFVLIDNRLRGSSFFLTLAPPVITIPRERYIVDVDGAPPDLLYNTLDADPVVSIERPYSLDEIRYNVTLRDRLTRLDLNTITFETGSWEIGPEQGERLEAVAEVIKRILSRRPNEIFLIEGHTDAVGNDVDNLSLSDRRAESVAAVLTDSFQIPPENLTTQGYGAQFLKVPTQGPSRENRRVAIRRITPLLMGSAAR